MRTLIDVLPLPDGSDSDGLPKDQGALPLDAVDATGLGTSALDTSALSSTEAVGPVEDTLDFIAGSCETGTPETTEPETTEPETTEPETTEPETTEPAPSHTGHGG